MKLINWIKRKQFLHLPIWVFGSIYLVVALLLPESLASSIFVFLFFSYFLARYFWRKHLKKEGKLGEASSGLVSLIFWGVLGGFWLYGSVTPEPSRLILYESSDPAGFDTVDHFVDTIELDEDDGTSLTRKPKKGVVRRLLSYITVSIEEERFICAFLEQEQLADECSTGPKQLMRVEFDGDAATVEFFMAGKKPETCVESACNAWLIQATQAQVTQFSELYAENEKVHKPSPTAEATLIAQWENIVTPVLVFNEISNGWRHLQITDATGNVETWMGK